MTKTMPTVAALCLGLLFAAVTPAQQAGSAEFTTFDAPGAGTSQGEGTVGYSINAAGVIAGYYIGPSGWHGFVRAPGGAITSFDPPGSSETIATSINTEGVIAGSYDDGGQSEGYVRAVNGAITTFGAPEAGYGGTHPYSINRGGAIAGWYEDASTVFHGFVRAAHGAITSFDAPGAGAGAYQGTFAFSINSSGAITGYFWDASLVYHSFVRAANGAMTTFDAPGAGTGEGQGTYAVSINDAGAITGYYFDASGMQQGFVRTASGTISSFEAPGAIATYPTGINASGYVVGYIFTLPNGSPLEGFVRGAELGGIATFRAPGAGTGNSEGTFGYSINNAGTIAGYYIDAGSVYHGFLLTPSPAESAVVLARIAAARIAAPAAPGLSRIIKK
jgi:predicted membrane protein